MDRQGDRHKDTLSDNYGQKDKVKYLYLKKNNYTFVPKVQPIV